MSPIFKQKLLDENILTFDKHKAETNLFECEYDLFDDSYTDKCCNLLYIEITDKCNYHCIHCYANMNPLGKRELSIEQIEKILSNIEDNEKCDIRLTGGEPFLHSKVKEIINIVKKNVDPYQKHSIVTNGSFHIDDALYAIENGFELQVSIYGYEKDTFLEFTNAPLKYWEIVQENLIQLSKSNYKENVLLCFAVNSLTYDEISRFKNLAEKLGLRYIFNRPASTGRAVENWERLALSNNQHYIFSRNTRAPKLRYCYHLCQLHLCVIDIDGNVFPCSFLRDSKFIMGNIFKNDLKDIWRNKLYDSFRKMTPTDVNFCDNCEFIYVCTAGCCAEAFGKTNNILDVYPWCKTRPYENNYLCVNDEDLFNVIKLAAGTFDFRQL